MSHLPVRAEVCRQGRPEQVQKEECANDNFVLPKAKWAHLWFSAWVISGIKSSALVSPKRIATFFPPGLSTETVPSLHL